MGAATERIDAWPGTGVGVLEAPSSGQRKRGRAALSELDDMFRIAGAIIAYPEAGAAMLGHDREIETFGRRVFRCVFVADFLESDTR